MSFATWVQLLRNLLCVLKQLLPADSSVFVTLFPSAQQPFCEITAIDFCLGLTQFLGSYFCLFGGVSSIIQAYADLKRFKSLRICLDKVLLKDAAGKAASKKKPPYTTAGSNNYTLEAVVLRQGIKQAQRAAKQSASAAVGVIAVGAVFAICGASTLKILKFISLLPNVQFDYPEITVHALIVLEVSLLYLLYPMILGFTNKYREALRGFSFAEQVAFEEENKATIQAIESSNAAGQRAALFAAAAEAAKLRSQVKLSAVELLLAAAEVGYNSDALLMDALQLSQKYPLRMSSIAGYYPLSKQSEMEIIEAYVEKDLSYLQMLLSTPETTAVDFSTAGTCTSTAAATHSVSFDMSAASEGDDPPSADSPWRDVDDDVAPSSSSSSSSNSGSSNSGNNSGSCSGVNEGRSSGVGGKYEIDTSNSCTSADIFARSLRMLCASGFNLVYFFLNATALCAYAFILSDYYVPYEQLAPDSRWQQLLRLLHCGFSSSDAARFGELIGDAAWTIEPALLLLSPLITAALLGAPPPSLRQRQRQQVVSISSEEDSDASSSSKRKQD